MLGSGRPAHERIVAEREDSGGRPPFVEAHDQRVPGARGGPLAHRLRVERRRERIGRTEHYHELKPLLWNLALIGPRTTLLREIGGPAAYRVLLSKDHRPDAPGAVGAAAERLRSESASLREIARWPGMTAERAARLLNALYMIGGLMVMRSHPAARPESDFLGRLLRFGRAKR